MIAITCDVCGLDLAYSNHGAYGYRLMLTAEPRPPKGRLDIHDVALSKPLKRDHHFCGLACLGRWLNDRQTQLSKSA